MCMWFKPSIDLFEPPHRLCMSNYTVEELAIARAKDHIEHPGLLSNVIHEIRLFSSHNSKTEESPDSSEEQKWSGHPRLGSLETSLRKLVRKRRQWRRDFENSLGTYLDIDKSTHVGTTSHASVLASMFCSPKGYPTRDVALSLSLSGVESGCLALE